MKRSLLSCCLLALALLTAHPAPAADMANTLVYAGENEDTINPVLSPHQELPTIIFSGLMKFDAKGLPVPDLAKSVDYDPKTLTYTFHLRDGVKWHDGAPFSARDVVYTYTALTSDKTLTSTITSNYQDISRISAPDEHTVVIRLARVNAAMLDNFCMGILPAHLYEGHDINTVPANHAPVGTGRFKFVSWDTAGGMIVLERNTDYYGKVPSIERIVYKTVAVESTKALMLRSGEADLAWLNAKYARTFRGKDGFTTVDFTTADLRTVAMDFHTPFWQRNKDSIAVLNYAVDKQAIVDGVLAGQGFPAFSPIQTSPLGGNPAADVYPYDLKKFAAEMERLGWKKGPDGIYARNGERFSFTIQVRDYEEERVDIINVLSRQFKKAGVEMNIALVTRFDWKAGYNGYLAGFAAEFDPDGVFKSFVPGASDNNMAYSSPKVDKLLREKEGIFLWCLEGLHRLIGNNYQFSISGKARENMETVKRSSNNVIEFLQSEGYIRFRADSEASSKAIYEAYTRWCDDNAQKPMSANRVSSELAQNERLYNVEATNNVHVGGKRVRGFMGIEVVNPPPY